MLLIRCVISFVVGLLIGTGLANLSNHHHHEGHVIVMLINLALDENVYAAVAQTILIKDAHDGTVHIRIELRCKGHVLTHG